jgi:hypothetical protein
MVFVPKVLADPRVTPPSSGTNSAPKPIPISPGYKHSVDEKALTEALNRVPVKRPDEPLSQFVETNPKYVIQGINKQTAALHPKGFKDPVARVAGGTLNDFKISDETRKLVSPMLDQAANGQQVEVPDALVDKAIKKLSPQEIDQLGGQYAAREAVKSFMEGAAHKIAAAAEDARLTIKVQDMLKERTFGP